LENKRNVEKEEAKLYSEENGLLLMETSAKNSTCVKELFHEIGAPLSSVMPCCENTHSK